MSELINKGRNLSLENIVVSYSPKDDSIHLTSNDPDLLGKPFHISLNQSSKTEEVLRELLIEQGVIKEELIGSNLPEIVEHPGPVNENPYLIDFGVSRKGTVSWDIKKTPHALVAGSTGSGKSVIINTILYHILKHKNVWDFGIVDFKSIEYSFAKPFLKDSSYYTTNLSTTVNLLRKIYSTMNKRYEDMEEAAVNNFIDLKKEQKDYTEKNILLVIGSPELFQHVPDNNKIYVSDNEHREEIRQLYRQLLRFGRAAGIHVLTSTALPQLVSFENKENMGEKILIGHSTELVSKSTIGSLQGARTPTRALGRGLVSEYGAEPLQFQSYFTPTKMFENIR